MRYSIRLDDKLHTMEGLSVQNQVGLHARVASLFAQKTGEKLEAFTWEQHRDELMEVAEEVRGAGDFRSNQALKAYIPALIKTQLRFQRHALHHDGPQRHGRLKQLAPGQYEAQAKKPEGVPLPPTRFTDQEKARSRAAAHVMAIEAARIQSVRAFRETFLSRPFPETWGTRPYTNDTFLWWCQEDWGDWLTQISIDTHWREAQEEGKFCAGASVLSTAKARRFLRSAANAFLYTEELAFYGVPFAGHTAPMPEALRAIQTGSPEKFDSTIRIRRDDGRHVHIPLGKEVQARSMSFAVLEKSLEARAKLRDGCRRVRTVFLPHTPLEELAKVASGVGGTCGWPFDRSAWWVLTGQLAPHRNTVSIGYNSGFRGHTWKLEVDSTVTPERLMEHYRPYYQWLHTFRGKSALCSKRNYDLVTFVLSHADQNGEWRESWPQLAREWRARQIEATPKITGRDIESTEEKAKPQDLTGNNLRWVFLRTLDNVRR
jgi:hypothetical protein